MNTETGEIKEFKEGDLIPENFVPINKLPNPQCPLCKGKGSKLVIKGKKKTRKFIYIPCKCTN